MILSNRSEIFWFVIFLHLFTCDSSILAEDWCARCHSNRDPVPIDSTSESAPLFPMQYEMKWRMHEIPASFSLPVENPRAVASQTILGETYYDWENQRMKEIYYERCIDIFPQGREYSCEFISLADRTYLIRFNADHNPSSCCQWQQTGFFAPRPDVLRNMVLDQKRSHPGAGEITWWKLDIPLPGPFGYGLKSPTNEPFAFWFPVIGGCVQQEFYDFKSGKPDEKHFELPAICNKPIEICGRH